MFRTLIALAALTLATQAAVAQDNACALTYDTYEISVPHTDMEACPDSMNMSDAFCRGALAAEVLTVYAFSEETLCLLASRAYEPSEFSLTVE